MAADHINIEMISFLLPLVVPSLESDGMANLEKALRNEFGTPEAKENLLC